MKKIRTVQFGTIELSEGEEEKFADTILSSNEGNVYLLNLERMGTDIYEWVDCYVKLVGWKYKSNGRSFIEVADILEVENELGEETLVDALAYIDDLDLDELAAWD